MALPASALTTLATAADELDVVVAADAAVDARIERYIRSASQRIAKHCGRAFERDTAVAELVKGFGGTKILVSRTPVLSLTSVEVDGTALALSDVQIEDPDAGILFRPGGWGWSAARAGGTITEPQVPGTEERNVEVTYSGGWVTPQQVVLDSALTRTLPEDIEDACLMLVVSRFRSRGNNARVVADASANTSQTLTTSGLPPEVEALLAPYVRIGRG